VSSSEGSAVKLVYYGISCSALGDGDYAYVLKMILYVSLLGRTDQAAGRNHRGRWPRRGVGPPGGTCL
jgi:hypothetical protein